MFADSFRPGLFSVFCGSELGDLPSLKSSTPCISTTDTIKATKLHTSTNKTTDDNDRKTSLNIFSTGTEASTSFAFPKAFTTNIANVLPNMIFFKPTHIKIEHKNLEKKSTIIDMIINLHN